MPMQEIDLRIQQLLEQQQIIQQKLEEELQLPRQCAIQLPELEIPRYDGDKLKWPEFWNVFEATTLKQSYKRPPHILSSSSESKIRSNKIHDHMNKPMSNSGSVSFCIPKCVILLTQTKHV